MAKRGDTLETTLLAIELLRRVPRNRKITASELHQQLRDAGIVRDVRTIQRQLEMLSEYFHLVRDDRNKPYGYQWPKHAGGLSIPNLTLQESLLLRLAEEHLKNLLPAHLMKSMQGFFAQARQNLGPQGPDSPEREWPGKVRVVATSQPLLPAKINQAVFEAVCEALYRNRWLRLAYRNAAGREAEADVMPLGLAQQGPRLYLVCRYEGYDNERTLAVNRIQRATVSTLNFNRPRGFELKRFDDEGRFGFGDGKKVRLTFSIDLPAGAHLLESQLSEDQQVKEIAGQYEISATVMDTEMLEWWLRGFGDAVSNVRRRKIA
jgi:predicted DNA-binding transcriptional regulator YafY